MRTVWTYLVPGVLVAVGVDGGEYVPLIVPNDVVCGAVEDFVDEVGGAGRADPLTSMNTWTPKK